jgi:hypothetical protein
MQQPKGHKYAHEQGWKQSQRQEHALVRRHVCLSKRRWLVPMLVGYTELYPTWQYIYICMYFCRVFNCLCIFVCDRLCGLVVRLPGFTPRGPGFDSRRYQIFWETVCLEQDSLSPMRTIGSYLIEKLATPMYKTEINGRGDATHLHLQNVGTEIRRPAAVAQSICRWKENKAKKRMDGVFWDVMPCDL